MILEHFRVIMVVVQNLILHNNHYNIFGDEKCQKNKAAAEIVQAAKVIALLEKR